MHDNGSRKSADAGAGGCAARPLVAVVLVGYGEKRVTETCIASLATLDYVPLRIIYVDNASPDGALEYVRTTFPHVLAIPSGGNLGYCEGNNIGIDRALEAGAEFILILNPDTVVCNPKFVTVLVDYMLVNPRVGKTGPKVYLREPGVVQNTIMEWPSIFGSAWSILRSLMAGTSSPRSGATTVPADVQSLNGCCLMVRAEALRDVGPLDASFWGYADEVDWDWRASRAGWKRCFVPVESIVHLQKTSGYDFAGRANFYMKRNTALWYAKTGKWLSVAIWIAATLLIAVIRGVFAPLLGRSPARYLQFAGKLAVAYGGVVVDLVSGKLHARDHAHVVHTPSP